MRSLGILCLVCFSRSAFACATCFGNTDAPQTHALNMAILFMLGIVAVMLGLFAAFFVHLRSRAKQLSGKTFDSPLTDAFVEVHAHE